MLPTLVAVTLATSAHLEEANPRNFLVAGFALGSVGTTAAVLAGAALVMTSGPSCRGDICYQEPPTALFTGFFIAGIATVLLVAFPALFEGFREIVRPPPSP